MSNISQLAREYSLTKPTVSDAVKSLVLKKYLQKDFSPSDSRRFNLLITPTGQRLVKELATYVDPLEKQLAIYKDTELKSIYKFLTSYIHGLTSTGVIDVQRICYGCRYYEGDNESNHYCNLLNQKLKYSEIRLDCDEFEKT